MFRRGIQPHPYQEPILQVVRESLPQSLHSHLRADANNEIGEIARNQRFIDTFESQTSMVDGVSSA